MSHIVCNASELEQVKKATEPFHFIRPLGEQPPKGYEFGKVLVDKNVICFVDKGARRSLVYIKLPYAPGDELVVKETWRVWFSTPSQNGKWQVIIQYKDESKRTFLLPKGELPSFCYQGRWRSGATMPRWASRYTLKVVGEPVVKRVQEIRPIEILDLPIGFNTQAGFIGADVINYFKDYWNSRWKKYPWESNPFAILFKAVRGE